MEIEEARNTTFEYSDNLQNSNDAVKEEPCSDYLYEEGSIKIEEHDLELDESIIKSVKIERDEDNKENEKSLTAFAQTLTKEHFKCEYITKQESSLKKHLLVHAGENSSKCGTSTKSDYASLQIVDSRSNLLVHKDEHFKCTKCDYRTTLRGDLTKHLLVHAREKSSKCGTSTKSDYASLQIVASRSNLSVHKDEHFKCTKCDYRTTLRGDLTKHLLIHAREKSFECGTSTKSDYASLQIVDSGGNLLVHQDEHFKCTKCDYRTTLRGDLTKHLLVHAREKSSKCGTSTKSDYASLQIVASRSNLSVHKDEHFKCTKCDYRTTLRGDLTKHLLIHAREKSFECGTSTKSDYASLQIVDLGGNLLVHQDEHFKCTKCDYRTTLRGDLTKHLLIHAREKSFECGTSTKSDYASLQIIDSRGNLLVHKDEHFKCTKCDYRTTLRGDLRKHLLVHAREKSSKCGTSTKSDYASLKKVNSSNLLVYKDEHFKCTKCDYRTTMRDDLKKHLLVHFGEKTCKCGTGTTGPKSDYASLQKVYSRSNLFVYKVENFKCTECEYRTTLGGDLKKNLLVHTGEKSSKCGTSTKPDYASLHKVDSRSNLLVHKDEHFKCTKCDYRTTLRGDLKKHLLVHTGEKSSKSGTSTKSNYASLQKVYSSSTLLVDKDEHFKCTKCEYRTTLRGDLKKHLLEHVSEKSYKCSVCDYTSLQRTQLNVHLLTHISAQSFKCDICDYACFEKSMLKRHFLLVHIDENPFKCN